MTTMASSVSTAAADQLARLATGGSPRSGSPCARRAAWVVVLMCALASFAPFDLEVPQHVPNRAERLADGSLLFAWEGRAGTDSAPAWLPPVIDSSELSVVVRARTTELEQHGPARILAVADDNEHANLVIGQEWSDLIVRVRRPGSDASGEPQYTVARLFSDLEWHDVELLLDDGVLKVTVDDQLHVADEVAEEPFSEWDSSYRLTLGNEATGERAWSGQIGRLEVGTPGSTVDQLSSDSLDVPDGWWRYRLPALGPSVSGSSVEDATVHLLLFAPLGFALVGATGDQKARSATLAVSLCVTVELGQLFFAGRHSSLADLGINLAAVAVGWEIGHRWTGRRRETWT